MAESRVPWIAAVPKTRAAEVNLKLYADAAEQHHIGKSLTDLVMVMGLGGPKSKNASKLTIGIPRQLVCLNVL